MFLLRSAIKSQILNAEKFKIDSQKNIARWVAPTLREISKRKKKLGPQPPQIRSEFLEWNYEAEVIAFGKRLGEEFNRQLLKTALIDKSYQPKNEAESIKENNSELIEEGINIIRNYLDGALKQYPEEIRQSLINYLCSNEMLSHVGKCIGLKDIILTKEFPVTEETLSNTFKAVVAALKHSDDLNRAEKFIADFLLVHLNNKDPLDVWNCDKPVEHLNELLEKRGIKGIEARLCNESAKNTILANYQVGWYSDKKLLGIGWGESIDIAKDTAALDAIRNLYNIN